MKRYVSIRFFASALALSGMMLTACESGAPASGEESLAESGDHGDLTVQVGGLTGGVSGLQLHIRVSDFTTGETVAERQYDTTQPESTQLNMRIPVGNYTVSGDAITEDGEVVASGHTTASVGPSVVTAALLVFQLEAEEAGTLGLTGVFNAPPVIEVVDLAPGIAQPGQAITIQGVVSDDQPGATVDIHWSSPLTQGAVPANVGPDGSFSAIITAPDTPGTLLVDVMAMDSLWGESEAHLAAIVVDPAFSNDPNALNQAVDTVFSNIAQGQFTESSSLQVAAGWELEVNDELLVPRSTLDAEVAPLAGLGPDAIGSIVPWVYSESEAVRYGAIQALETITGQDLPLSNFDVPGFTDEDLALEGLLHGEDLGLIDDITNRECCVDFMATTWSEPSYWYQGQMLRLDYIVDFGDAAPCDPACCQFRQNVMTVATITPPGQAAQVFNTAPMHDDNYSRADDTDGNPALSHAGFTTDDNPGFRNLPEGSSVDYSFTAEQLVIDTCNAGATVRKIGPHTATVKGTYKADLTFGGDINVSWIE